MTYNKVRSLITCFLFLTFTACEKDDDNDGSGGNNGGSTEATCSDGKKNQDENGVDCGGSCGPCDYKVSCESSLSTNEVEVGDSTYTISNYTCTDQGSNFTIQGAGNNGGITIKLYSRPGQGQKYDLVGGSFGPTSEGEGSVSVTDQASSTNWHSQNNGKKLFVGLEDKKFTVEFCGITLEDDNGNQKQSSGRVQTNCP